MNKREILEMALRVESLAERNYANLAGLFPEAMPLFALLSREESRHADIITITLGFLEMDALPAEFSLDMLPLIEKTLDISGQLEKKIIAQDITLEEALDLSLLMEETGAEAYFQSVMRGESTDSALNYVKQFYTDSKHHADLIREFREVLELKEAEHLPHAASGDSKRNCWEVKGCGRQPAGTYSPDCPAVAEERLDGIHGGVNAGRACWVVAGTMCGAAVRGAFAQECGDCRKCDFYEKVKAEEDGSFRSAAALSFELKERKNGCG